MRSQDIEDVKAELSQIVCELPEEGSLVITRNGQPCAVLMPVHEETDLEVVALSQNQSFLKPYDQAVERAASGRWTSFDDL